MRILYSLCFLSMTVQAQKIIEIIPLSKTINETSGLEYFNGQFITHNDSGGEAALYSFNQEGEVIATYEVLNAKNKDWEDITQDDSHVYIGDHGNNKASRKGLKIYKTKWNGKAFESLGKISFRYVLQENFGKRCMHAFDADEVGSSIIVKRLPTDTSFTTLDGKERKLSDQDLMICNTEGGMCLAGVFGGQKSGVTNETTDIFLESACFSPEYVRSTAQRHGLNTDASFRFERSTDPEMTIFALKYATQLILEIAGGYIASDFIDLYPHPIATKTIPTAFQTFDKLIGETIDKERIIDILNSLDIKTTDINANTFNAHIPPYRSEVIREADLVEEVLRIYGINNIAFDDHFSTEYLAEFNEIEPYKWQEKMSYFLSGKGYQEILTNSLTNKKYEDDLKLAKNEVIEILNRSSEDLGILKPTPLYTALESVRFNLNRKQESLKLYEFSKTYGRKNSQSIEKNNLCLLRVGNTQEASWMDKTTPVTFHHLSGDIENLIQKSGNPSPKLIPTTSTVFEYGIDLYLHDKLIGHIGKLASKITHYFDIKSTVFYAEVDWSYLVKNTQNIVSFQKISKYPEVRRDLSLVIKKTVSYDEIKQIAQSTENKLLSKINVFSIYEGDKIGSENKAYAIAFYLQDQEKTLNDKKIDKIMSKLMYRFENELNAIIRK